MLLWKEVAAEAATWCCASTTLDYKTVKRRVEHEGDEFLSITLPAFGKAFERWLEEGQTSRQSLTSFRWQGGLPLFLRGFLERVFDSGTGRLLENPCIDSILAVRQLTLQFGKILPDPDKVESASYRRRNQDAIRKFLQCEQEVRIADRSTPVEAKKAFHRLSVLLFGQVFSDVDLQVYNHEIMPKHGPGATADRLRGNAKFDQREWPLRLERVFPYALYASPNGHREGADSHVDFLEPGTERPVRVVFVPKTPKSPRVIAIEPTAMQYMQQGLLGCIVPRIQQDNLLAGFIGFDDQGPNRAMARLGSRGANLATLDLSEASDRVSAQHVRLLLANHPHLRDAVEATRSRKAAVPGGRVIRLAKFASMGSALCFPFEAMVFLTLVFLGIERDANRQLTRKDIKSYTGRVRVYGDDIIVPVDHARSVIGALEDFGLRVNTDKSFWTGKFRESCGGDYYDGVWVTPVRVRRNLASGRSNVQELMSTVSLRNQFYFAGYWRTAAWLDRWLEPIMNGFYPTIDSESAALGRHSLLPPKGNRMCPDTQVPMVRAWVPSSKPPRSSVSGEGALLKCLLSLEQRNGDEPVTDSDHLERYGRPDAVNTKLRWTPLRVAEGVTTY